ncbi:MAG: hypothetical protein GY749_05055 [Desulfobacteraceae bacterium]|nr:hypothetical protein [Desulfobacteraceae bacterium]
MLLHIFALLALSGCQTYIAVHTPQAVSQESKNDSQFCFVQITDTHFGDRNHIKRTKKIADRINKLPMEIKCVVHTGDITMDRINDKDILNRGLEALNRLKVPIHYVPGNHDIIHQNLQATHKTYVEKIGDLISQAEYENVIFLFVYTEPLRKSFSVKDYEPLKTVKEYLGRAGKKPVIVFHHAPSVEDFYLNKMHKGWDSDIREKWINLLNSYNVKAVIAGHFHRDEHHWLGNVPLYVCSPVAGYWGRQATFRIYEYKNGKLSYRTQYIK